MRDIYDNNIIFGTEEINGETAIERAFREAQGKKAKKEKEENN